MAEHRDGTGLPDTPASDVIGVRGLLIGAGAIALTIAITIVVAFVLVHVWSKARAGGGSAPDPGQVPVVASGRPRLQPDPARDIAAYRAEKAHLLESYGWVDRSKGIVRIPVQRAMELLAQAPDGSPR